MLKKNKPLRVSVISDENEDGKGQKTATEIVQSHLERYDKSKKRSRVLRDLLVDQKMHGKADKIAKCATWLNFHNYYRINELRLVKANFCKQYRLCPACAYRRGMKFVSGYMPKIQSILEEDPDLKAYMMTITVKNGKNLKERYNHLKLNFRELLQRRRDFLNNGFRKTEFSKVVGMVYSIETTYDPQTGYHPHLHAIVLAYEPLKTVSKVKENEVMRMPKDSLNWEWFSLTRDSWIVQFKLINDETDMIKSLCEVFKYALKFSEMPAEQVVEADKVLNRKRLVGSIGNLRNVQMSSELLDDPIKGEPYQAIFYRYLRGLGYKITDIHMVDEKGEIIKEKLCA